MAEIIDGTAFAAGLRQRIVEHVEHLKSQHGVTPGLAVVLVGGDPASQVYVGMKVKVTKELGMTSVEHRLPEDISQEALLDLVRQLNDDPSVHGVLVQLPLPKPLNSELVLETLSPEKDVDGLTVLNGGRLFTRFGKPLIPCTPLGAMMLIKSKRENLSGLKAVVIGRSNLFGKPMAQLLLQANCTVTMAHSRTQDLPSVCREADILVAAVGQPQMVKGNWVKPGAIVIDVGINRIDHPEKPGKTKLVGDVATQEAMTNAAFITPVPGGAGPMTIACLMTNTVTACYRQLGLEDPEFG